MSAAFGDAPGHGVVVGQCRTVEQLAALISPDRPPTAEQAAIIAAGTEPTLVVAGAGSGKTETLSMRIVYLLDHARELFGRDIGPDEILCLTFTRKAAAEIAERAHQRISAVWDEVDAHGRRMRDPERPQPAVSTYNAYAAALAAEHGLRVGVDPDSTVLTAAALWQLAVRTVEEWREGLDTDAAVSTVVSALPALAGQLREHGATASDMRAWAMRVMGALEALPKKAGDTAPGTMTKELAGRISTLRTLVSVADLIEDFQARKHAGAYLDFADQVAVAVELAGVAHVQQVERSRYAAVLLDEFQDTSPAQLRLFAQMFGADHPVMAVGDPNQAIYGFRGASAAALGDFVEQFGGLERVRQATLSVSWRNEASVLAVANAAAEPLRASSAVAVVELTSRGQALGLPEPRRVAAGVHAHMAATHHDEAEYVADFVVARRRELGHGVVAPGEAEPIVVTAAVLCRRRSQFASIADALARRGIEFEVVGLGGLLETPDVADLVALLEVAHDPSRGDALMRLLTSERVNLGPRDLMALRDWSEVLAGPRAEREGSASIVDALADLPPVAFVSHEGRALTAVARARLEALRDVVTAVRRHTYLPLTELIAYAERAWSLDIEAAAAGRSGKVRRAIDAFIDAARSFAQGADRATLGAFLAWLDAARAEEGGLETPVRDPDPRAVQIVTAHAAKGLEWDVVAIPGANDGHLPSFPHFHGDYVDGAWLSGGLEVPWELRLDAARLPRWRWEAAYDHASLGATIDDFRVEAGAHTLEEERRLFYVALTRARSHVLVSGSWFSAGKTIRRPSIFVRELIDQGLLSDATWAPEPERGTEPPPQVVVPAVWPRETTATQASLRALAGRVAAHRRTDADTTTPEGLPLAREVIAMLSERAARASDSGTVEVPAHLSTSALVAMKRDRDAFALQLRRPVPVEPTTAAHRGSALHAWIEARFGYVPLWEDEDAADDAETLALDALKATFLASEWAARTPTHVEADVEVPVGAVTVRSRIDAVFAPGLGLDKITVVDWKSGRPPSDPHERSAREIQLAMYRLAWAEREGLGIDEVDAAFYYVATNETVRPNRLLTRTEIEELLTGA